MMNTCLFRIMPLSIVSVAAIGLLTACGEHSSSETPLVSTVLTGANANSAIQCFHAVGHLSNNDAELFAASGSGDIHRAEQSIAAGGNVNAMDLLKRSPLFAAAFCNHPEVVNLLIDKGAEFNTSDFIGMSPLHAAIVNGGAAAASALISRGASIDIRNSTGETPLHLAAATNQMAMVKLLLERGADAQVHNKDGISAAALASVNGHTTIAATIKEWREKQKALIQK